MKIMIFGGGMQGKVIAENLAARAEKPFVTIADIKEQESSAGASRTSTSQNIESNISFERIDVLNKEQVKKALNGYDVAILAVPSSIAHDALKNLIATGISIVDVSFTPEPPLSLHEMALASGSSCIIDCGIAPGLSHIMVGQAYKELGALDSVDIFVGGIPQEPPPVFNHAIYFNTQDLVSEYIRPARARVNGIDIAPDPLEAPVAPYKDPELGELDAFLSDGLRTLLTSYPTVPDMQERTLRWPGHLKTMADLRTMGFFEPDSIISTADLLTRNYPDRQYADLLLMHVGARHDKRTRSWRVLDRLTNGLSAMSRTTGFTTAAAAMVLARKQFNEPGVYPPEKLGEHGLASTIISDLQEHGIQIIEETHDSLPPRSNQTKAINQILSAH